MPDLHDWEIDLAAGPDAEVPGTRTPVGRLGVVSSRFDGKTTAIAISQRGADIERRTFDDERSAALWLIDRA